MELEACVYFPDGRVCVGFSINNDSFTERIAEMLKSSLRSPDKDYVIKSDRHTVKTHFASFAALIDFFKRKGLRCNRKESRALGSQDVHGNRNPNVACIEINPAK